MSILKYNDYELLYLIQRKSDIANQILFDKYKLLVFKKLKKYNLDIMTREDLVQDCMFEMHKSITKYNDKLNILFITYVDTIFERKINRTMMKVYKEIKHVDYVITKEEKKLKENHFRYNSSLENMITESQLKLLYGITTFTERLVIKEVMFGKKSLTDFCLEHNLDKKKLYNTIQQIRKKCSGIINEKQLIID